MSRSLLSQLCPPSPSARTDPPEWLLLCLTGLTVLYTVLPLTQVRLPNAIEVLFALTGLYVFFRYAKGLRWSVPVKLMAASVVVLVVSWLFMILDHPDLARSGPSLEDFLDKFFFLFIALVVAGSDRRALGYLCAFSLFILLMPWLSGGGFDELRAGFNGRRAEFGINPIRTGLLFGTVFLGLVCFAPRIFLRPRFSPTRCLVWVVLTGFCIAMIAITQSRTAMVSLLPGIVIGLVLFLHLSAASATFKTGFLLVVALAGLLLVSASHMTGLSELVAKRFGQETVLITQVLDGNMEDIPTTSWGIRIHFFFEGVAGLAERPLTGWGYRAGEIVLDKDGLRQGGGEVFSQVHNAYLEAALRYGLAGAAIFLGLFAWALKGSWKSMKERRMPLDLFVFLGAAFSYFMIANLFDGLLFQTEGILLFNVLMGVAGSYVFFQKRARSTEEDHHHAHPA